MNLKRLALILTCILMGLFFMVFSVNPLGACTSILLTKGASQDGSTMISYSGDGKFHPLLRMIPAADHQPDSMVEVYPDGKIPQVPHTYKLIGWINEYQLAMGETTTRGRKELVNPDGMLYFYQLMDFALQRAKTAREAISVMTTLAEKYGYADLGESISIADKEEVWLLEIFGTGKGGKGAVWVAMRIPDGMICAHSNMSRIREFPLDDPDNVIYSKNVISFAIEKGYYDPKAGEPFSFSKAYCPPTEEQVRYSSRRIWNIFRRAAPSLNLSSGYSSYKKNAKPYPLYIKPDRQLSVRDVIALHRDHFEGTEFDMTKDVTAGPFGTPDRWRPMKWEVDGKKYLWERPISAPQTGFLHITQSRSHIPDQIGGVYWYLLDNAYTSIFTPFYTSISQLPESYTTGTLRKFSRDSAWWAFNFVANYANLRWSYMVEDIRKVQKEIEDLTFQLQPAIEATALQLLKKNPGLIEKYLTNYCVGNAEINLKKWWRLADFLVTKYNDGYIQDEKGIPQEIGYPEMWLKKEVMANPEKKRVRQERED